MKKIYVLPNLFTTANMFCGFYAIVASIHGNFQTAAVSILVAMVFDSMDGRVARLTRATSAFGVEYDSLSDLISFGMAPGLTAYLWALEPWGRLGWLASFLYVVCAALRLARFNVLVDKVPKRYFQGLPSPLAAATVATSIIFYNEIGLKPGPNTKDWYIPATVLALGSLMVSTIRFPSFKEFKFSRENSFGVLAVAILSAVLLAVKHEVTLFAICVVYIVVGMGLDLYRVLFRRDEKVATPVKSES
ncbi:MAG: CDP-diacylglycerol--serine O-phosphatidyltransferase [Deltaproteobacteria bacterium]|nr:CDP-diacylglycerol--serine O-phosphatidyltransferase [Deltaproteobacteria bacterium]